MTNPENDSIPVALHSQFYANGWRAARQGLPIDAADDIARTEVQTFGPGICRLVRRDRSFATDWDRYDVIAGWRGFHFSRRRLAMGQLL